MSKTLTPMKFGLDDTLREQLRQAAKNEYVSEAQIIRRALRAYLNGKEATA